MRWREVDFESAQWTVPAVRMKARRAHRVPLSRAALAILASLKPEVPLPDQLVFPGAEGATMSDMTVSAVIRRMNEAVAQNHHDTQPRWRDHEGRAVVPHGFRSTFRDWAGETRSEGREVVERALAHVVRDKAEAAYARSDLFEKRRPLMDAWSDWCLRPAGEASITHLSGARRRTA
jgi:integrase